MATTTNYSWTTPDDTALVKDGAAAIRSLGTAIDTTVFNNAGAAIAKTIVDAKGDLIVGTAADTVARLASSASNGDLLTVDTSTASGLKWAAPAASGAFTKISRTSFSNVAGQEFSDVFTSTYPTYRIVIENIFAASANDVIQFQVKTSGGVQSASYYGSNLNLIFNSTAIDTVISNNNGTVYKLNKDSAGSDAAGGSTFVFDVINAGINGRASWSGFGNVRQSGYTNAFGGYRAVTETVTGFKLSGSTSNITGTVAIYGYGA